MAKTILNKNNQLRWLLLSVLVIILDQVSKMLISAHLVMNKPLQILPVFNLVLQHNAGAAFGFLRDETGWQRILFVTIAAVISIAIIRTLAKLPRNENITAFALALILGGAIGNVYDRVALGYVVDFISLHFHDWYFATFNIADSAITVGVIIWLTANWFKK